MNTPRPPNPSRRLALLSMVLLPSFVLASPPARDAIDLPQLHLSAQLSTPLARDANLVLTSATPPGSSFVPNSCESSAADLCYDAGQRRAVYRPARAFMPGIEGLTAENVSLRRGVVTFKYSFR
jgi:hypothetical protein